MKRITFFAVLFFYTFIGTAGFWLHTYTEAQSFAQAIQQYRWVFIMLAVVIGGSYFYWFKQIFPKGYSVQNQFVKLMLPLLFIVLSYALNLRSMHWVNTFGPQDSFLLRGRMSAAKTEKSKSTIFYKITIKSADNGQLYEFDVPKAVYQQLSRKNEVIVKEFKRGWLGIIYRVSY